MPHNAMLFYTGTSVTPLDEADLRSVLGELSVYIPAYTERRRGNQGLALVHLFVRRRWQLWHALFSFVFSRNEAVILLYRLLKESPAFCEALAIAQSGNPEVHALAERHDQNQPPDADNYPKSDAQVQREINLDREMYQVSRYHRKRQRDAEPELKLSPSSSMLEVKVSDKEGTE